MTVWFGSSWLGRTQVCCCNTFCPRSRLHPFEGSFRRVLSCRPLLEVRVLQALKSDVRAA